jgi:Glycosyltransferase WbsX
MNRLLSLILLFVGFTVNGQSFNVVSTIQHPVYPRAGAETSIEVTIKNEGKTMLNVDLNLLLPFGVSFVEEETYKRSVNKWKTGDNLTFIFKVIAEKPLKENAGIKISKDAEIIFSSFFEVIWNPAVIIKKESYVPIPVPLNTGDYFVGAFRCPLWGYNSRGGNEWHPIVDYPERMPILGYYDERNPEVADWEIKFAVEHGISFFVDCWFRSKDNIGKPAKDTLGYWINEALPNAKYKDFIKFALLWENGNNITTGISSESDLLNNLMPYWINNYFKRDNYLKFDNKPVFILYVYENFVSDLGGEKKAAQAITKMREVCKKAGFNGLILLAEYHQNFKKDLSKIKDLGFDGVTSYHWPSFSNLGTKEEYANNDSNMIFQQKCWGLLHHKTGIHSIPTVSMGWDSSPWGNSYYKDSWHLSPENFGALSTKAMRFSDKYTHKDLGKIIFLDNWNEYGEGHYIFPVRQYGFEYLDAIRAIFEIEKGPVHFDLVPEDVKLGPYQHPKALDRTIKKWDFDDNTTQNWHEGYGGKNTWPLMVKNGNLEVSGKNNKAQIILSDAGFVAEKSNFLEIKMKTGSKPKYFQVFYTNPGKGFNNDQSVIFSINELADKFFTYKIPLTGELWTGNISSLRIDLIKGASKKPYLIEIDYIKITK